MEHAGTTWNSLNGTNYNYLERTGTIRNELEPSGKRWSIWNEMDLATN